MWGMAVSPGMVVLNVLKGQHGPFSVLASAHVVLGAIVNCE